MTTWKQNFAALFILSLAFSQTVWAQDDQATTTDTTTETVESNWYRSEQISGGQIDAGDFLVGPGRVELTLKPGETIISEVSVTNRISDGKIFTLEIEDVTGSSDGSKAVSLVEGERGPYSVRDYISVPQENFSLKLGERARIPVRITVPLDAEPGGYYGSVLVSTDRVAPQQSDNVPRSPIIARISTLFFITVEGEVEISGETKNISTVGDKWWYESGPITFGILYENTGSLHVNPYGEVSIKNMFGEEVGFVQIEPWFVLPKSQRFREITWDREFMLGRYVVTAKINRGYDDIVDEVTTTFWVLPWKIVGGTFLILFIIIFSIRALFKNFEFRRKT